jgi:hypothetical protein
MLFEPRRNKGMETGLQFVEPALLPELGAKQIGFSINFNVPRIHDGIRRLAL